VSTFSIRYRFSLPNGKEHVFLLELQSETCVLVSSQATSSASAEASTRPNLPANAPANPPEWAALKFHQCKNCPLPAEATHCPSALQLSGVIDGFADVISYDNLQVTVETEERAISARLSAQQGLASLIGLIMATSGCPSTAVFRPMARFHLPFSSEVETAYRSASMYLIAQQFIVGDGGAPDLHMAGLERIYRGVHEVNRGMAQRLRAASRQDAIVNAVVQLDVLTNLVPATIEELLQEIRPAFEPLLAVVRKTRR